MHPIKPALNGSSLKTFSDPDDKLLFVEMVKVVQEKGQGTVDYKWERPDSDIPQPKTSYVKGFSEWDWIVGTGVYVDDIVAIQQSIAITYINKYWYYNIHRYWSFSTHCQCHK